MSEKPSCSSSASKRSEQLERLRNLHMRRNEARTLNYQEVVEEDRKTKLPANWENKQKWAQYKLDEEKNYEDASKRGEDYARLKLLNVSADEAERLDRKKKRKNPDFGFSDYEAATVRQYTRLVKQIKPDMEVYERKKEELGEALYPTRDTIIHGLHKDSKEDVDRMVQDLEKHWAHSADMQLLKFLYVMPLNAPTTTIKVLVCSRLREVFKKRHFYSYVNAVFSMFLELARHSRGEQLSQVWIDKRNKYSRRRRFNDDEDIDYINERNMKFNKKLERFYGQYTAEIKQNLERGTAV